MRSAKIIIGANYGDEAKGLFTDFFCAHSGAGTVVVRFNGGAQAAHTVQLRDGRRHVFSHFGSGSFTGAATYLSSFFVCNPIVFAREWDELAELGITPDVFVDPFALVTTPYDMMVNQIVEEARGANRHGSCGLGFGETIGRNLDDRYRLNVADLGDAQVLLEKLERIRTDWMPQRLAQLGVTSIAPEWTTRRTSEDLLGRFLGVVDCFNDRTVLRTADTLRRYDNFVFEGAQGLLLDQDKGDFPHVTRSNTGLKNVIALARVMGIDNLDVHYATRAYMTRHGAGPLPWELAEKPYPGIIDQTNVPNPHQGALRFAWLDIDRLSATIADDLGEVPDDISVAHNLALSCMDQVGDRISYVQHGCLQVSRPAVFIARLQEATGARRMFISRGPTRDTVKFDTSDSTPTTYLHALEASKIEFAHTPCT